MKILFFTRLYLPHFGGVEKHTSEVTSQLLKKGHEIKIACELDGELPQKEKINGVEIYRIKVSNNERSKKFFIWQWLLNHRSLVEEADIVHCHDVFYWYLPFKFLHPQKKVFTTFHGYETHFPPSKKAIFIRKISEKLSNGNICVGYYINKWYGTTPTNVTYGGVNYIPAKITPAKNKKILFVGRLEEDTGVRTYLKTFGLLKKEHPDISISFCGDGNLRKLAEKYGKVFGFKNDISAYLKDSRLIFASSYLSMLEAMVNKRIIVATYENPLKEDYLKMSPFKKFAFIDSNPEKLADDIVRVLDRQVDEKVITENAFQWAKDQTWEKVTNQYLKLWGKNK